ncbi:MAG: AbrB family transcriptional regulator [Rhodobacteraceae bacterium]|nr:AbrB family transcriptional regulator [Paracoccaceae bacterium]
MLTKQRLATLAYAGIGAAASVFLGFPLPLLLGPLFGLLAAALAGLPMQGMGAVGMAMRTFLGVAIGSTVTPELLASLPAIAMSLLFVIPFTAVVGAAGFLLFRRLGFDRRTSFYSAMPGGLQDMLIFGEEAGGNVRAMSLIHATRVLVIFIFVPIAVTAFWGLDLRRPPGQFAAALPHHEILLMVAAGLVGWWSALKLRIPGASLLGPIALSAALSLSGLINSRPPVEMLWAAQFAIGIGVGVRYSGITAYEVRAYVLSGAAYSLIVTVISVALIILITIILPVEPLAATLAFLPGGQAEMAMIAVIADTDVAYVIAHHITRIFLVILFAQLFAKWLASR